MEFSTWRLLKLFTVRIFCCQLVLTIFSLSDHSSIIVIFNFTMSIPKGKTQLPRSLRNWCKPINSRHCKYTSSSNFILSTVLSGLHHIGSHNAMLGPFGIMLDVVFIILLLLSMSLAPHLLFLLFFIFVYTLDTTYPIRTC